MMASREFPNNGCVIVPAKKGYDSLSSFEDSSYSLNYFCFMGICRLIMSFGFSSLGTTSWDWRFFLITIPAMSLFSFTILSYEFMIDGLILLRCLYGFSGCVWFYKRFTNLPIRALRLASFMSLIFSDVFERCKNVTKGLNSYLSILSIFMPSLVPLFGSAWLW